MELISNIFVTISGLGKYIMVPIMVTLIGLGFKCSVNKAVKGGITVGIGLFGLDLALTLVSNYLGPIATALVEKANLSLDVIDVGWTALSGIAYATEIGAFIIPFMVLVNVILLGIGATKTMNIDIWNFWHYALTGSLIYFLSGNIVFGFLAATTHAVVIYSIADRTAETTQQVINIPGISIPHGGTFGGWVIGYSMEYIYNFFGKKSVEKSSEEEEKNKQKRINKLNKNPFVQIIKDPIYVGFILGVILALIGGFDAKVSLTTGMAMSALMYLTPRMVQILMEGLMPISDACKTLMSKKYKGEQLYIGMDNAIILGHPTVMLGTVVMIPICIILAMVVPGNRIIPLASLAACGYNCTVINVAHRGKALRTFVSCTILLAVAMLIGSIMAPSITDVAVSTGYGWEQTDFTLISAISGTLTSTFWLWSLFSMSSVIGSVCCVLIIITCVIMNRRYFKNRIKMSTTEFVDAESSTYTK